MPSGASGGGAIGTVAPSRPFATGAPATPVMRSTQVMRNTPVMRNTLVMRSTQVMRSTPPRARRRRSWKPSTRSIQGQCSSN